MNSSLLLSYILLHGNLSRNGYAQWVFKKNGRRMFEVHQERSAFAIINAIGKIQTKIFAVLGNADVEAIVRVLHGHQKNACVMVDRDEGNIDGLTILGVSGAITYLNKTPICDNELSPDTFNRHVTKLRSRIENLQNKAQNLLFVMHEAPRLRYGKAKFGSAAITRIIREYQPIAVVFGHHHQVPGVGRIGRTLVINPGPVVAGHFGILELKSINSQFEARIQLFQLPIGSSSFSRAVYGIRDWILANKRSHSLDK